MPVRIFSLLLALAALAGCTSSLDAYPWRTLDGSPPIIIAHRGDSGNYPEHTLLAYDSAIQLGADYIEPDVVLTKDGVAVCRHDLYLSTTTYIQTNPAFTDRKRAVFGREDWFVFDLTLSEIKSLRADQPARTRNPADKARLHVPCLSEVFELVSRAHDDLEAGTGLYIEIKKPAEHRELGLDPSLAVVGMIQRFSDAADCPPIILQCFDRDETERLAALVEHPVVYLSSDPIDFENLPEGIAGLGLNKGLIEVVDGRSELVEEAHRRGLFIHVWTFRDDQLDGTGFDDGQAEIEAYLQAGVDGVFTDFPETGVEARRAIFDRWQAEEDAAQDQPITQRIREDSPRRFLRSY